MGQYYHPISLDRRQHLYSHTYDNGLKLMEHSYIGNGFVETVCALLCEGGDWAGNRIVWAGDYADEEIDDLTGGVKPYNLYGICDYEGKAPTGVPDELVSREIKPTSRRPDEFRFLTNLDKKIYVDLDGVGSEDGWRIHPLPLLTSEGNGRGGGDYEGTEMEAVGSWARDHIVILEKRPNSAFSEVSYAFKEGRG